MHQREATVSAGSETRAGPDRSPIPIRTRIEAEEG